MVNRSRLTQVLPETRIIPRVEFLSQRELENGQAPTDKKVHPDFANKLCDLALRAYAVANNKAVAPYKDESLAVIFASTRALNAANHFVSEKAFETTLPDFRKLTAKKGPSLRNAVAKLLDRLPTDGSPPFPQMRELAGEREWQAKLNPAVARRMLKRWLGLMDELNKMTSRGRSPITAEVKFVGELAHYWRKELGARLVNSRGHYASQSKDQQGGLFADFVRKAAEIIPQEYRPRSWEHAIRAVTARDADDPERRLLLPVKNNLAPLGKGFAFRLEKHIVGDRDNAIVACAIAWESSPIDITADAALQAVEAQANGVTSAVAEAEKFLKDILAGGPVPQKEIKAAAEGAGLAWTTVRRAKGRFGIKPHKDGMDGGWLWALPKVLINVEDAHLKDMSAFGGMSTFGAMALPPLNVMKGLEFLNFSIVEGLVYDRRPSIIPSGSWPRRMATLDQGEIANAA